ncbi:MAG: Coenzyme F420 hydrogenase/dehydrogenase, beta subunit C-terminal domain [Bacteroidales bacterium]|nr:Coenzyme F420 hydrogenase/dehydrogenase, beta subunit C-terminal domain [Bacteroidales bacterium]
MIKFDFNIDCCGCTSCANSCPVEAIAMKQNENGFLMPVVNEAVCIQCGKCERVCPHLNIQTDVSKYSLSDFNGKNTYLYYLNEKERNDSASGGFVYAVSTYFQQQNGVVCGCIWNKSIVAEHICSSEKEDLHRMQSSKYVQSDLNRCFSHIKKELAEGRKVLFCGTPCQTAGLHFFLGNKEHENLLSIAVICHGVGSPLVWEKYKKSLEKKYGGKLLLVNQRDKSFKGYNQSFCKYTFKENLSNNTSATAKTKIIGMPTFLADPYVFLFTDNLFIRNSCCHCQYKGINNHADIIVGDFYESLVDAGNMGCSCLIAMTEKGDTLIRSVQGVVKQASLHQTVGSNAMLWKSVAKHPRRDEFFHEMENYKDGDIKLFLDFLPIRFKIKKVLNQLGLFNLYLSLKRTYKRYHCK